MTHGEFKKRLKRINNLFKELEKNLIILPEGLQEVIQDYHNSEATLQYTIRWGLQGSGELLEDSKKIYEKAKEDYDI